MRATNVHIDRLTEVPIVQNFMKSHDMAARLCESKGEYSLVLYRLPFVLEMTDTLIENYLEVTFSDMDTCLMLRDGAALSCSIDLGYQNRKTMRGISFAQHPQNNLFLSDGAHKMHNLHSNLEAIDKLLPLIESKGGLTSMRNGTFDPRFDFSALVTPMYHGLSEKYLRCIQQEFGPKPPAQTGI